MPEAPCSEPLGGLRLSSLDWPNQIWSGDAREVEAQAFHGSFLRSDEILLQNCAILRDALQIGIAEIPSVRNAVRHCEKLRKNTFLNYESPALTAELQAGRAAKREHGGFNARPPIFAGSRRDHPRRKATELCLEQTEISKVYFTELRKDVQERFHCAPTKTWLRFSNSTLVSKSGGMA
jgi:hypothetical protein